VGADALADAVVNAPVCVGEEYFDERDETARADRLPAASTFRPSTAEPGVRFNSSGSLFYFVVVVFQGIVQGGEFR